MSDEPLIMSEEEAQQNARILTDAIGALIAKAKPSDMDTQRIMVRMALMLMEHGVSRTNALGAVLYGVVYGALTGLTEAEVVDVAREAYTIARNNPSADKLIQAYTEANLMHHMGQMTSASKH